MRNHETNPPPKPASDALGPEQPTPRRGWPNVALGLVAAAGIAVGAVGGMFIPSPAAETPTACITAIDLADEALAVTSNAMGTITEAFTALSIGNETLAEVIMEDLDGDTQKISNMQADYHAAKDECRASQ